MAFRALNAALKAGSTASGINFDFDWNGSTEGESVQGNGWTNLRDDGQLGRDRL